MRIIALFRRRAASFEAWVMRVEGMARATLESCEAPGDADAPLLPNDERAASDYARLILARIAAAREAITSKQPDQAARAAAELGYLVGEADAKTEWRKFATTGARVRAGSTKGAEQKAWDAAGARKKKWTHDRGLVIRVDAERARRKEQGLESATKDAILQEIGRRMDPPRKRAAMWAAYKNGKSPAGRG